MYARIIDSRNFWRAAAGGQARSQRITRGRKNQFLRRNSIKEKIRVRQTDGRSERRTESIVRYYLPTILYGTNHKSYIPEKNKRAKNLFYGTVQHKSQKLH